jgi:rhodanese-related sulfurtransferase
MVKSTETGILLFFLRRNKCSGGEDMKITIFRKRNLSIQSILSLTILFMGILVLSQVQMVYCNPFTVIDTDAANDMITSGDYPNLIIIDVRGESFYDVGHLENAINIPSTEFDSRIDELMQYNETEIILYCQFGATSQTVASSLDSHGFTKVFTLGGGFDAWESAGLPVIPELSSIMLIATLMLSTVFVAIVARRKRQH